MSSMRRLALFYIVNNFGLIAVLLWHLWYLDEMKENTGFRCARLMSMVSRASVPEFCLDIAERIDNDGK